MSQGLPFTVGRADVACIVIAGGQRMLLLDDVVLPRVGNIGFADVLVVGEHHAGTGYRYLEVPRLSGTTNDALVKRDVGTLATDCEYLFYLNDDHYPKWREPLPYVAWDVIVPQRWASQAPTHVPLRINNGEQEGYCGGHGGLFKRSLITKLPWTAGPHHRCWDLLMSKRQQEIGGRFVYHQPCVEIVDVEPNAQPWC